MHYLSAALVIFIDLFTGMDNGYPEEVLASKRADIPLICSLLQERMRSVYTTTATFASHAFGVVTKLLEAEKTKKAAMAAVRDSVDGSAAKESEPVGRVLKRIAQSMSESTVKNEPQSSTPSLSNPSNQSSPEDVLATSTRSTSAVAEQPTVAQPNSKKTGKQSRRASIQPSDTTSRPSKQAKVSPETARRPSVFSVASVAESKGQRPNAASPTLGLQYTAPIASSSRMPELTMDTGTAVSRHDSFSSAVDGSTVWFGASPALQERQPASLAYTGEDSFESTRLPSSYASQHYVEQASAPITWDVSALFSSDPSTLLHSMGFPATQQSHNHSHFSHSPSTTPTLQPPLLRSHEYPAMNAQAQSSEHDRLHRSGGPGTTWYPYQNHYERN
ncbi:hypothetical protein P389DRAFT_54466 [Cystobasidium minutum MCA 4210]|uniref:uncharacterized protein n=1 Tax=Cystobasidium minutum MCA 4210 TaxID=1397322 RepID=UPI0034CDEE14|eukprot:jgi/Rhomi1/54466/CE54465_364